MTVRPEQQSRSESQRHVAALSEPSIALPPITAVANGNAATAPLVIPVTVATSYRAVAKRAVDIVAATVVLLATLPLLVVIAALVALDSPGPLFYRCERVGHRGGKLWMLKFRKMHEDAAGSPLTTDDDERFTRIGAWLARTKLDELPQFWHVLRGDMSLVGPRPEDPEFVAEHPAEYARILEAKPGIIGLSQVAFAAESSVLDEEDPLSHYVSTILPQKVRLDQMYIEQWRLRLDASIFMWSAVAVLLRRDVAVDRGTGGMRLRRR